jgi:hypothetical protein
MMKQLTIADLMRDPDCYPEGLALSDGLLGFCRMDHAAYRRSPFLDHRIEHAGADRYVVPFAMLGTVNDGLPETTVHYIFHNAFCSSTLLTRYLDMLDDLLVLREPNVLYEVLTLKRVEKTPMAQAVRGTTWNDLYDVVCKLLARRYNGSMPTVIKPTDGCNFMMHELVSRDPHNRALFLYSRLEHFIVSVLRFPMRHQWVRLRAQELLLDAHGKGCVAIPDPSGLDVAQVAALVWSLHTGEYIECVTGDRQSYASVCADDLMTDPVTVIAELCRHFALPVDTHSVSKAVAQMDVTRNVKAGQERFDAVDRQAAYTVANATYRQDIDYALSWIETLFPGRDLASALPRPLSLAT